VGGIIDTLAIGAGIIVFAYLLSRLLTRIIWPAVRPKLARYEIYGDVVEIPAAAKSGGGTAAQGSSRVTHSDVRTHRNGGV